MSNCATPSVVGVYTYRLPRYGNREILQINIDSTFVYTDIWRDTILSRKSVGRWRHVGDSLKNEIYLISDLEMGEVSIDLGNLPLHIHESYGNLWVEKKETPALKGILQGVTITNADIYNKVDTIKEGMRFIFTNLEETIVDKSVVEVQVEINRGNHSSNKFIVTNDTLLVNKKVETFKVSLLQKIDWDAISKSPFFYNCKLSSLQYKIQDSTTNTIYIQFPQIMHNNGDMDTYYDLFYYVPMNEKMNRVRIYNHFVVLQKRNLKTILKRNKP